MLSKEELRYYGENCRQFFSLTKDTMTFYGRKFRNKNIEIYPSIFSEDDLMISFLKDLQKTLSTEFAITAVDRGIFTSAPIINDFSTLKTKSGSVRPTTHARAVEVDPTRITFGSEEDHKLFDTLMAVRYDRKNWINKLARISNDSSSGAPFFINDAYRKKKMLDTVANKLEVVDDLISNNRLSDLFEKFGLLFFANTQIRRQADIWIEGRPKIRQYLSFEDAFKEGTRSKPYSYKESTFYDSLNRDTGLATCRTRSVVAYSAIINYLFTALIVNFRDGADKRYEFTYKHRKPSEILDKCRRFGYFRGLDVKNFDGSVPFGMVNRWVENLPVNDIAKRSIRLLLLAPKYDSETKLASGDPLNHNTFRFWTGLPSGIFCTSMIGKDVMSFKILKAIQEYRGKRLLPDDIITILEGKAHIGFLNQGDDSVIMSREDILDKIIELMNDDIFSIEQEQGISFLGNLIYINKNNSLSICNNLCSYFDKVYVPERSINTKLRPYPMLGIVERRNIYSSHPLFEKAREIEQSLFKSYFNISQREVEERHMKTPSFFSGDRVEIEILTDPDKLKYKYDESEVSEELANLFSSAIDERTQNFIQRRYLIE